MGSKRNPQLVRIHMAKKALDLDDDTYRSLLQRVGGCDSSAKMTPAQRNAVIAELVRMGFREDEQKARRKHHPGAPANVEQVPMLRKVEALLAEAGREWNYAHAMANRMFQVKRLEWLRHDQLHTLVAALQVDAQRRGAV